LSGLLFMWFITPICPLPRLPVYADTVILLFFQEILSGFSGLRQQNTGIAKLVESKATIVKSDTRYSPTFVFIIKPLNGGQI